MRRTHKDCVQVVMHFHDEKLARGTVDAASLDDRAPWLVEMRRCDR